MRVSSAPLRPRSRLLTQEARQLVGFLLLDGLVVQRLKVDIQDQDVIAANRQRRELSPLAAPTLVCFVLFPPPFVSSATFLDIGKRGRLPALPADNAARRTGQ